VSRCTTVSESDEDAKLAFIDFDQMLELAPVRGA
jgi:hypothetical protein